MSTPVYKMYERNLRTAFEYYGIDEAKKVLESWYYHKEIGFGTYLGLKGVLLTWMN